MTDDDQPQADPVMARVTAAITRSQGGDVRGAREEFDAIWRDLGPGADPFHRCTLAHYAADVQDDPRAELAWDLHALDAARSVTDARVKEHHASLAIEGFFPSLHLNLAEDYRKLGDPGNARRHVAAARERVSSLPDDGYGTMIHAGIERVAGLLEEDDQAGGVAGEGWSRSPGPGGRASWPA